MGGGGGEEGGGGMMEVELEPAEEGCGKEDGKLRMYSKGPGLAKGEVICTTQSSSSGGGGGGGGGRCGRSSGGGGVGSCCNAASLKAPHRTTTKTAGVAHLAPRPGAASPGRPHCSSG